MDHSEREMTITFLFLLWKHLMYDTTVFDDHWSILARTRIQSHSWLTEFSSDSMSCHMGRSVCAFWTNHPDLMSNTNLCETKTQANVAGYNWYSMLLQYNMKQYSLPITPMPCTMYLAGFKQRAISNLVDNNDKKTLLTVYLWISLLKTWLFIIWTLLKIFG